MNKLTFISEVLQRIKTKSPALFIKIQWISGILGVLCLLIIGAEKIGYEIKSQLVDTANYLIWLFIGIFTTGTLPIDNKVVTSDEQAKEPTPENNG